MPGLLAGPAGAGRGGLRSIGASAGRPGRVAGLAPGSGRGRKAGALASVRFRKYAARPRTAVAGSGPGSWRVVQGQIAGGRRRRLRPGAGQAGLRHRRPGPSPAAGQPGQHPDGIGRRGAGLAPRCCGGRPASTPCAVPAWAAPASARPGCAAAQPAQCRAARGRAARGRCSWGCTGCRSGLRRTAAQGRLSAGLRGG